jgi:hypothetical protein
MQCRAGLSVGRPTLPPMDTNVPDRKLAELITLIDVSSLEITLTVTSNGQTVTGQAVAAHRWFEEQAARVKNLSGAEGGLHELFELWQTQHREAAELIKRDLDNEGSSAALTQRTKHVHLQRARFVGGDGMLPNSNGLLWRCQLSSVTGWALGELRDT